MARQGGIWLVFAGINGAFGVIGGAIATHGGQIAGDRLILPYIEVASRYQLIHALALIAVALMVRGGWGRWATLSGCLFAAGLILFCGGLYAAGLLQIGFGAKTAPYGGFSFIAGWLMLSIAGWRGARG